jgi:hypothetical protein
VQESLATQLAAQQAENARLARRIEEQDKLISAQTVVIEGLRDARMQQQPQVTKPWTPPASGEQRTAAAAAVGAVRKPAKVRAPHCLGACGGGDAGALTLLSILQVHGRRAAPLRRPEAPAAEQRRLSRAPRRAHTSVVRLPCKVLVPERTAPRSSWPWAHCRPARVRLRTPVGPQQPRASRSSRASASSRAPLLWYALLSHAAAEWGGYAAGKQ